MDVIIVSQLIIVLEVIIAIIIIGFFAYVIVTKAIRKKKMEERLILTNFVEAEVAAKMQEHISNQESLLERPSSSEVETVQDRYDHQLLEGAFALMGVNREVELPEWEVQLAKAEARLKQDTQEAQLLQKYGYINPGISCPYCREKGKLRTRYLQTDIDFDVSLDMSGDHAVPQGARASTAKHAVQAYCGGCEKIWTF